MNSDLKNHIIHLYKKKFRDAPKTIEELAASGSSRKYFRLISNKNEAIIAAYNNDKKENQAFISFTKHFEKHKLAVPMVLEEDLENNIYLLRDLGDETLFSYLEKHRKEGFNEDAICTYKQVLELLLMFQIDASADLDYSVCYPRDRFDKQSMMWDLNYFKYYFLKLAHINFDEQKLEDDFNVFAEYLLKTDCNYFLYRDFQSRNIMIHEGKLFFIDYQGGRRGALQYDVASLLYDAKADIPQKTREHLLDHYISSLKKKIQIDENEFRQYYYGYVLIRIMQAMGAYGFRGYYEKKVHFLKSIPFAVVNLQWIVENIKLPVKVETLMNVFQQIISSDKLKTYAEEKHDLLTVRINSFSFKKGFPPDPGGNGGGFVFDCRALPNPGRFEEYKLLTGKDDSVKIYLEKYPEVETFFVNTSNLACQSVDNYISRGFKNLIISYGCTGGQHRSVYFAERLAKFLKSRYSLNILLNHQEQK
jgi:aminoglycoside/choline kinase family phosphotransferase